jgi:HEAT repeat protein
MQRGGSTDRPWAALALGQLERAVGRLGQPSASESGQALRSAARDGTSPDEVAAACLALGLMGDGGGAALLRAAYERSSEFDPRGQLALALGLAKDRSHAPALLADLSQARFRPSYMAQLATGLALMQETSAVPTLLELLADARSAQSQAAAAGALASCGDLRAVTALTELLARRSNADLARAAAAAALGQIADRDPLPWRARITPGLLWSAAPSSLVAPPGSAPGLLNLP